MAKRSNSSNNGITHEEIAGLAYSIFEKSGRIQGHDVENWLQAEAQLLQARKQAAQSNSVQRDTPKHVSRALLTH